MSRKNSRIAAQTIVIKDEPAPYSDRKEMAEQAKLDAKIAAKRELRTLAEIVAGSKFYYKNWLWDHERKFFPHEAALRHVDFCFPQADGGKLLIDEPIREWDRQECLKKQIAIEKAGYRYLILHAGITENEAFMMKDALGVKDGLGIAAKCAGRTAQITE